MSLNHDYTINYRKQISVKNVKHIELIKKMIKNDHFLIPQPPSTCPTLGAFPQEPRQIKTEVWHFLGLKLEAQQV